jgi:hypothetical protein
MIIKTDVKITLEEKFMTLRETIQLLSEDVLNEYHKPTNYKYKNSVRRFGGLNDKLFKMYGLWYAPNDVLPEMFGSGKNIDKMKIVKGLLEIQRNPDIFFDEDSLYDAEVTKKEFNECMAGKEKFVNLPFSKINDCADAIINIMKKGREVDSLKK